MNRLEDFTVTVVLYALLPFALLALGVMLIIDRVRK
jgi:hypothetical protein